MGMNAFSAKSSWWKSLFIYALHIPLFILSLITCKQIKMPGLVLLRHATGLGHISSISSSISSIHSLSLYCVYFITGCSCITGNFPNRKRKHTGTQKPISSPANIYKDCTPFNPLPTKDHISSQSFLKTTHLAAIFLKQIGASGQQPTLPAPTCLRQPSALWTGPRRKGGLKIRP